MAFPEGLTQKAGSQEEPSSRRSPRFSTGPATSLNHRSVPTCPGAAGQGASVGGHASLGSSSLAWETHALPASGLLPGRAEHTVLLQDGLPEHDTHTGLATLPEQRPRRPLARPRGQCSGLTARLSTPAGLGSPHSTWAPRPPRPPHCVSDQSHHCPAVNPDFLSSYSASARLQAPLTHQNCSLGGLGWQGDRENTAGAWLCAEPSRPCGDSEPQPSQTCRAEVSQLPGAEAGKGRGGKDRGMQV